MKDSNSIDGHTCASNRFIDVLSCHLKSLGVIRYAPK
jgi:hypothetical protein